MSRFGYVRYDEQSISDQVSLKNAFEAAEQIVDHVLPAGRAKSLVMTHLEEAYMWCGKGVRDKQIERGGPADLQEERKDG